MNEKTTKCLILAPLTSEVSLPPTILIPRPLGSFFSSMVLSSFLAGDFPGDFAGVLAGDLASDFVGLLAGVFWASLLGPAVIEAEGVVAESGDKVAFLTSVAAGAA